MNILLLEDDTLLGECARVGLAQRDFSVEWVTEIRQARRILWGNGHECLLLDLNLPDGDGLEFLRELRQSGCNVPVIVITARYQVEERIKGLEYGADDYLTKPYSLDELAARLRAVLRRQKGRASNILTCGDIYMDPLAMLTRIADEPVDLPPMKFRLLRAFLQQAGKIQPRESLLQALRGDGAEDVASNLLDVHIHNLRKKLGSERIKTVRGLGYILVQEL
ncbi:response regulator [Thiolapillus brandeum]|uniref:Two-component system OmpR family response regulator QseB n=1 Tax=Thiolapillus brandeum TaxID=1076588 RepID=A0A7U6GJG9_9GAMM|nr:response regulator [Thiolapillus brandeum]BAO44749.1 two-component system OmpR family response regulator QseB [Thiolapillus brandeum]